MEDLIERCAGMDVHKDTVVATVSTGKFGSKPKIEPIFRILGCVCKPYANQIMEEANFKKATKVQANLS